MEASPFSSNGSTGARIERVLIAVLTTAVTALGAWAYNASQDRADIRSEVGKVSTRAGVSCEDVTSLRTDLIEVLALYGQLGNRGAEEAIRQQATAILRRPACEQRTPGEREESSAPAGQGGPDP